MYYRTGAPLKVLPHLRIHPRSSFFSTTRIILQFISKMNNSSLCTLNTTISTWFWVRFKVFNHSGKNYLLTFKNNFRRRALAIDFSKFSSVMKSEEEVLSYHADLPIHYEKKIFRNNPRYEFFQKIFFPKSFNHPKFTKKTSIWASKSLN